MSLRKSHPELYNLISLTGFLVAVVSAATIVLLFGADLMADFQNPYLGIIIYFIGPAFLVAGLVIAAIGAARTRRRRRAVGGEDIPAFPVVNLNDAHQRKLVLFFTVSTVIFVVVLSLATIKGYDFSESPTFCGKICHTVMEPEYTAWMRSPHARVKCVECHIGPGAKWFVKSKLSGLRQVVAVIADTYPRPIPVPIENLRPSRETCEHCHWPSKLYFQKTRIYYHYAQDEGNTPREIRLTMKVGGSFPSAPVAGEIHWHINKKIVYVARDASRQDIPYVAVDDGKGNLTEFLDSANPPSADVIRGNRRTMDCMDCHNRPSHIFRSPAEEIDRAFVAGRLDRSLPYIKRVAVDLLSKQYATKEEAKVAIATGIEYHLKNYPVMTAERPANVAKAIEEIQYIYSKNVFPKMKVQWNTYANNIGHFYSLGCFRCHDGKHRSRDGRIIPKNCSLCHVLQGQKQENIPEGADVREFVHPIDIGGEVYTTNCSECHGVVPRKPMEKH